MSMLNFENLGVSVGSIINQQLESAASNPINKLRNPNTVWKRKSLWLFKIPGISASGINSLAPTKAARPSISFKENEVQHLNETIYFPGKPEFKELELTLLDYTCKLNPVFEWLKRLYDPSSPGAEYKFVINSNGISFKVNSTLEMFDGCGKCLEKWTYENCWPKTFDFQEVDMASNELSMINLTIRYDRAYIISCSETSDTSGTTTTNNNFPDTTSIEDSLFINGNNA